jgi:hypothetical protein
MCEVWSLSQSKNIPQKISRSPRGPKFSPLRELGRIAPAQGEYRSAEKILLTALKDREADLGVGDVVSERYSTTGLVPTPAFNGY